MNLSLIEKHRVIPVVVIERLEETNDIMQSLKESGLPIAEITFRTACAKDAIKFAVDNFPEILVGAGTVIDVKQCEQAISVGAKFIVGPGFDREVSAFCRKNNAPYFPGCVTPTEIIAAIKDGWNIIKFFPANVYGGITAMKSLAAPFPQIKFIPTGGVDADNLAEYLSWDKIHAVGGSWMMKGDVTQKCKEIRKIVEEL